MDSMLVRDRHVDVGTATGKHFAHLRTTVSHSPPGLGHTVGPCQPWAPKKPGGDRAREGLASDCTFQRPRSSAEEGCAAAAPAPGSGKGSRAEESLGGGAPRARARGVGLVSRCTPGRVPQVPRLIRETACGGWRVHSRDWCVVGVST